MLYLLYILIVSLSVTATKNHTAPKPQDNPQDLVGTWKLDMTPNDANDNNFAMMRIEKVDGSTFTGKFYREGVNIQNGQLNTQTDRLYGALISQDNSGRYHTTYYLKEGKLFGSTHAIERNFLAVWVATKTGGN